MKLKDVKVGKRLFIGFGIIELIIVFMVWGSIFGTRNMKVTIDELVSVNNVKLAAAYEIKNVIDSTNLIQLQLFLSKDEKFLADTQNTLTKEAKRFEDAVGKIIKLETTAEGKEIVKAILEAGNAAKGYAEKVAAFKNEGKTEEGIAFLTTEYFPIANRDAKNTERLIDYEQKLSMAAKAAAESQYRTGVFSSIATGTVAIALALFFGILLTRSITAPVRETISNAQRLSEGDLTVDVKVDSKDEFGQMAVSIKSLVEKWREVIGSIKDASDNVASASTELSAGAEQMSKGAGQQAERSHQVATASQEMSQTVLDVAGNASNIASTATGAAITAKEGGRIVEEAVKEVKEIAVTVEESSGHITSLAELSQRIGEIIGIINEIADQTNLLALNAAIEAARAGEHGRGFAVVADEVRKLAERTTGATSEVSGIIREIQNKVGGAVSSIGKVSAKVDRGVELSTNAGSQLTNIVGTVEELQSMVQQIASAIEEMSATSDQISNDIESISGVSKETARSSEEVASSSVELSRLGSSLQAIARQFKL